MLNQISKVIASENLMEEQDKLMKL